MKGRRSNYLVSHLGALSFFRLSVIVVQAP